MSQLFVVVVVFFPLIDPFLSNFSLFGLRINHGKFCVPAIGEAGNQNCDNVQIRDRFRVGFVGGQTLDHCRRDDPSRASRNGETDQRSLAGAVVRADRIQRRKHRVRGRLHSLPSQQEVTGERNEHLLRRRVVQRDLHRAVPTLPSVVYERPQRN